MSNTPRRPKYPTPPPRDFYPAHDDSMPWWRDAMLLIGLIAVVGSLTLILARCAGAQ